MDWTGGTRRRYAGKGKGNAVLQKQKAHFAKARATTGYQVIPETYVQAAASSRGHLPRMIASPFGLDTLDPRSHETSHGRSDPMRSHGQSQHHNTDRAARKTTRQMHNACERPDAAATEEDRALIANRKRLLAQDDWLGLAATRPVRLTFPSDRDRQRIGKRRKVDKPRIRMGQPAEHRTVARPSEARFEAMMSGAITNDDIQIKVGTDAFLSQTQPSRRSRDSPNTSIRPVSTDFGPISEESMLMKADSDGFEALDEDCQDVHKAIEVVEPAEVHEYNRQIVAEKADYINGHQDHAADRPWKNLSLYGDFQPYSPSAAIDSNANSPTIAADRPAVESSSARNVSPRMGQHVLTSLDRGEQGRSTVNDFHVKYERMHRAQNLVTGRVTLSSQGASSKDSPYRPRSGLPGTKFAGEAEMSTSDVADEEHDEQVWKGFMHVRQAVSSGASVAALRSSSQHLTQSTTSVWPRLTTAEANFDDEMLDEQEYPHDYHPQADTYTLQQSDNVKGNDAAIPTISPSPAHHHTRHLLPEEPVAEVTQEDDDQDQLWRQFVLGSQSSQSQPSPSGRYKAWTNDSIEILPAQLSSAAAAASTDEQLRSDRMTTGGGSTYAYAPTDSQDDISSQNRTNTSLIGHATTTINPEREGNEEEESESKLQNRRKTGNIHAANSQAHGMPRRDYGIRKRTRYAPVPRVLPPRVLMKTKTLAPPKSIYDLSMGSDD